MEKDYAPLDGVKSPSPGRKYSKVRKVAADYETTDRLEREADSNWFLCWAVGWVWGEGGGFWLQRQRWGMKEDVLVQFYYDQNPYFSSPPFLAIL